jgi:hypothetical protein
MQKENHQPAAKCQRRIAPIPQRSRRHRAKQQVPYNPAAQRVANASTITPSRSNCPAVAAVAPSTAKNSVPARSAANKILSVSGLINL